MKEEEPALVTDAVEDADHPSGRLSSRTKPKRCRQLLNFFLPFLLFSCCIRSCVIRLRAETHRWPPQFPSLHFSFQWTSFSQNSNLVKISKNSKLILFRIRWTRTPIDSSFVALSNIFWLRFDPTSRSVVIGVERATAERWRARRNSFFCKFATERLDGSSCNQKNFDRTSRDPSNDVIKPRIKL